MTTWGLAATIKAPFADIIGFTAYHIDAGAHRLYLYLDDPESTATPLLKSHPKVRVFPCDDAWWAGKRPKKHQVRQGRNATHAYTKQPEVDWLIHMDVDEFLVADQPVSDILGSLPVAQQIARVRPMEQLAGNGTTFKAFIPNGPDRAPIVSALYPTFGPYLKGGFLSHLAGKVFVRTGLPDIKLQIHNAFQDGEQIEGPEDTPGVDLAHCHARSWEEWLALFRFRLSQGSYRADLAPNRPREKGGMSMHDLFNVIEAEDGETGLRHFFEEVCADTPDLRSRLDRHGLLRQVNLALEDKIVAHFPTFDG